MRPPVEAGVLATPPGQRGVSTCVTHEPSRLSSPRRSCWPPAARQPRRRPPRTTGREANPSQAPGGGGGNPTRAPGGGGGGATQAPGGGGGNSGTKPAGGDRYGKVSYAVSGPATASGELGFAPPSSVFATGQLSLSFFDEASQHLLALRSDGTNAFIQFADGKITFIGDPCPIRGWKVESLSASGSFDCDGALILESGAIATGAKIKGSFTASAK